METEKMQISQCQDQRTWSEMRDFRNALSEIQDDAWRNIFLRVILQTRQVLVIKDANAPRALECRNINWGQEIN